MRTHAALLALLIVLPVPSRASETEPGFRFHGGPLPRCTGFVIWETSFFQTPLSTVPPNSRRRSDSLYFSWEYGAMVNTSPRTAWGATGYFTADGEGTRVGLLPRYRRWLRGKLAADFSAGPFLLDSHHDVATRFQGVLVRSSITLSDLVSVSAQLDAVREDRGWATHPYAGIRVGSYAAIPMTFFNFVYASVIDEGYMSIYGNPVP